MHALARRELENYLLVPRALLAALNDSRVHDPTLLDKVTSEDIELQITDEAALLYGVVLLKRVRAALSALFTGLMWRKEAEQLAEHAGAADLASRLMEVLVSHLQPLLDLQGVTKLVEDTRAALDDEWQDPVRQIALAPGEEILTGIYRRYGVTFNKVTDGERVVRQMTSEEIEPEIQDLLRRATSLAVREE